MKFKVVVVDLELSRREKRALGGGIAACVLAGAAIAYASVPTVWSDGDVLTATDLNGNFSNLDGRTTTLENARTTDEQTIASQGTSITTLTNEVHSDESTMSTGFTARLAAGTNTTVQGQTGSVNPTTTQILWQSATTVVSCNASGQATVTFPTPFPNGILSVVVSNGDDSTTTENPFSYTPTGFKVQVRTPSGPATSGNLAGINWIAIGW